MVMLVEALVTGAAVLHNARAAEHSLIRRTLHILNLRELHMLTQCSPDLH